MEDTSGSNLRGEIPTGPPLLSGLVSIRFARREICKGPKALPVP